MSTNRLKSQFHHYVPRFMLKKWKVEYVPPDIPPPPSSGRKGKSRTRKRPIPPTEECYINMYDFDTDIVQIGTPISRAFGVSDLYKDDEDADNVYRVEQLFSKLESQAAQVLRKLDIAISVETLSVSLTRKEVNVLRKFLFLQAYRNERHAAQFLEERFDYSTRTEVETFRKKHNLKDIYAVYLFNLRNFLQAEHWEIPANEKILKSDRDAYHTELEGRQLAFYVVSDETEFILTNNGLGLWEGTYLPSLSLFGMVMSPGSDPRSVPWRHTTTYPVSSRLLVLLRSTVMTQQATLHESGARPEEVEKAFTLWGDKIPDNSYFKDFPRTRANVRYIPPLTVPLETLMKDYADIGRRTEDKLTFRIHMLNLDQSLRVNALRLENTPRWITYKSPRKLLESIKYYETTGGTQGTGTTVYQKRTYASLVRQLEYLIENGVPPPPVPANNPLITRTSDPTSPATDAPHSEASQTPTAPLSGGETEARAQGLSFLDLLRARSDPTIEKPPVKVAEPPKPFEMPEVKPRNPLMRRKLYSVPVMIRNGNGMLLQRLAQELMPPRVR